ncbi:MAG: phosphodiester glycosidase family protein [Lachnospiraceae bacterium]|nr:phosphodiester glycosidase family protein [Lachnospiraceae bacterium]
MSLFQKDVTAETAGDSSEASILASSFISGIDEDDIVSDSDDFSDDADASDREEADNTETSSKTNETDSGSSAGGSSASGSSGSEAAEGETSGNAVSTITATNLEIGDSGTDDAGDYQVIGLYTDDNIQIILKQYRYEDTDIYVADIQVTSAEYLKSAFANNTYGKNVTAKTSAIAGSVDAILAINGDYYGAQESGYVIRNGVLYRDTSRSDTEVLCIYVDGSFEVVNTAEISAQELVERGVWQAYSFGPGLIEDGQIAVTTSDEVGKAMASNPRTAIGMISQNHYVMVVSDGRTDASEGLSLYQLAAFMENLNVETAYNLDGGGSSTMYFQGQIINNPTTSGRGSKERSVSDIVYIGY